jgi:hypothetical protein
VRATILFLGILILLLLQAVEVWRRIREPGMMTPGQFWRRILTAAILQLALLMWLVGEPLMRGQPPLTQLSYWSAVLLFGFAAAFFALREMGEVTRQYHRQRAELFRRADAEAGSIPRPLANNEETRPPRNEP